MRPWSLETEGTQRGFKSSTDEEEDVRRSGASRARHSRTLGGCTDAQLGEGADVGGCTDALLGKGALLLRYTAGGGCHDTPRTKQ